MKPGRPMSSAARSFYLAFRRWNLVFAAHAGRHTGRQCLFRRHQITTPHQLQERAFGSTTYEIRDRVSEQQLQADNVTSTNCTRDLPASRSALSVHRMTRRQTSRARSLYASRAFSVSFTGRYVAQAQAHPLEKPLRHALRALTKPCVVITTCARQDGIETFSGATLSSFDTVSLHPEPYISFNIKMPSRTYENFQVSKQICVHILSASVAGATVADAFTKLYDTSQEPFDILKDHGAAIQRQSANSAPRIHFADANIAWLICEINETTSELVVGDHKLCTFVVKDIIAASETDFDARDALSYGQRAFRRLGERIEAQVLHIDTSFGDEWSSRVDHQARRLQMPASARAPEKGLNEAATMPSAALGPEPQSVRADAAISRKRFSRQSLTAPFPMPRIARSGLHTTSYTPIAQADDTSSYDQQIHNEAERYESTNSAYVDPSTLKQTVGDFLCHSPTLKAPDMTRQRKALAEAAEYRAELSDKADGWVDADDAEVLHRKIQSCERAVLIKLAKNAALELQEMLDLARVSRSRIQFMESCIERGQAALLEEAKEFAAGKERRTSHAEQILPDDQAFKDVDQLFRTELLRLRDLMEEEDDVDMLD